MCYMKKQPLVVLYKDVFLKISQNLQEKTPVEMAYFQESSRPEICNFLKKETLTQVFSCWFWKVFKSISWRLLVSVKETTIAFVVESPVNMTI